MACGPASLPRSLIVRLWLFLLLLSVAATLGVAWARFPLGVPGEWTWARLPPPSLAAVAPLAIAAGVHLGIAWAGSRRIEATNTLERTAWLSALVLSTFGWLWVVQEEVPSPAHQLSKAGWVLYYPSSSGYFTDARRTAGQRARFLAAYEHRMAQGDVLHIGTHPPGLVVIYWGLMDAGRVPALANLLDLTQPASAKEAFAEIERLNARSPTRLSRHDREVLWLAALLVQATAALTVIPLYWLGRFDHSRTASWCAACLWAGVPALAIFLPKSDVLLAFLGTLALAVWMPALRSPRRSLRIFSALATGAVLFVGLNISLALLPAGLVAALLSGWEIAHAEDRRRKSIEIGQAASMAGAVLAMAVLVIWLVFHVNLLNVWRWNLHNHAAFYAHYPRTWWAWLLVNPLECSLAAGLPLTLLALGAATRIRGRFLQRAHGPLVACGLTWLLLWLSGKNSGEAARLWIFVMPWLCWIAAGTLSGWEGNPLRFRWLLVTAWAAQLACSAILATHVAGFFTSEMNVPVEPPRPAAPVIEAAIPLKP